MRGILGIITFLLISFDAQSTPITLDFSEFKNDTNVSDAFTEDYYAQHGLYFDTYYTSSLGQNVFLSAGQMGLVADSREGGIKGSFWPVGATSLSVGLAPSFQGTWEYTLSAYNSKNHLIGRSQRTHIIDYEHPDHEDERFKLVSLFELERATRFTIESEFLDYSRERLPYQEDNTFRLGWLTFDTPTSNAKLPTRPVSEPGTLGLLVFGLLSLVARRKSWRSDINIRANIHAFFIGKGRVVK